MSPRTSCPFAVSASISGSSKLLSPLPFAGENLPLARCAHHIRLSRFAARLFPIPTEISRCSQLRTQVCCCNEPAELLSHAKAAHGTKPHFAAKQQTAT